MVDGWAEISAGVADPEPAGNLATPTATATRPVAPIGRWGSLVFADCCTTARGYLSLKHIRGGLGPVWWIAGCDHEAWFCPFCGATLWRSEGPP